MGATVQPEAGQQPLRVDVTLDEIEKGVKAADEAAKVQKATDDAKKAAEAQVAVPDPKVEALKEALRLSEESRKRLEVEIGSRAAVPAPVAEPAPRELTREELAELYEKKPLDAIEYMQARAVKAVEENLSRRLVPLVSGSATSAEEMARTKYPDEFKIFGDEIRTFVASAADKSIFSVPKNWDDMIAWMRGKPGNFEKLLEHRVGQDKAKAAADAQAMQAATAGAHAHSDVRAPAPRSDGALDETERAIIKELTASGILDPDDPEADYRKWKGVGR